MTSADILIDAFGRIRQVVNRALEGAAPDLVAAQIEDGANSIAWLVWHLTRIQDDHVADVAGTEQVYTSGGWVDRFGLPFEPSDTGFGHSSADVAAVQVGSVELLKGYHDAVHERTVAYVKDLSDEDLHRIVDESYDPPVSLGVRLVSVISDNLQHAGQAAYARGVLERTSGRA